jgi:hypothetical protein
MSQKISWTLDVQVEKGPTFHKEQYVSVDAYDYIEVDVDKIADPNNPVPKQIFIHAGGDSGPVQFVLINSDKFSDDLSYSIDSDEADAANRIKLDGLQVLMGKEIAGQIADDFKEIYIYNNSDSKVRIQVLVGRMATK